MIAGIVAVLLLLLLDGVTLALARASIDLVLLGYLWLSATIPALACAALAWFAVHIWRRFRRDAVPNDRLAALLASLVALAPAFYLASRLTQGRGLRATGNASLLQFTICVAICAAFAILAGAWRRLAQSGRWRWLTGLGLLGTAGLSWAMLAYHPVTYMPAHRGFLLLGTVLCICGVELLLTGRRHLGLWQGRTVGSLAVFALLSAGGVAAQPELMRWRASSAIFHNTLVAQKLLSPFHALMPPRALGAEVERELIAEPLRTQVPEPSRRPTRWPQHDVVLVTADAFRFDAIDRSGSETGNTPVLSELLRHSWDFAQAFADYSHTSRSLSALMAGSPGAGYWARGKRLPNSETDRVTRLHMTQTFMAGGYRTVALMPGRTGTKHFTAAKLPGFDEHIAAGPSCGHQVAAFRAQLQRATGLQFTWLHFFDTHAPLTDRGQLEPSAPPRLRYSAAVRRVDTCIGEVIQALRDAGRWDHTILVFTADHGEALGEHRRTLEHSTCYAHDIRVPLVMRLPDDSSGTVRFRAQSSDVLPTLASLVDLNSTAKRMRGRDLSALLRRSNQARKPISGRAWTRGHPDQYPCMSLVEDHWHIIYSERGRHYELYDIEEDPQETRELLLEHPGVFIRMRTLMDQQLHRGFEADTALTRF